MGRRGGLKLLYFEEGKKAVFEARVYTGGPKTARVTIPHAISGSFIGKTVKVTIELIENVRTSRECGHETS